MVNSVPQFMVTIETKNYPVTTIRPAIQRYARIRKKMNATEIANCLAVCAVVTLEKKDGSKVRLTANNFRNILYAYTNELKNEEYEKKKRAEEKKNAERVQNLINTEPEKTEEVITEPDVTTTTIESTTDCIDEEDIDDSDIIEQTREYEQVDPEYDGVFDDSAYYEE